MVHKITQTRLISLRRTVSFPGPGRFKNSDRRFREYPPTDGVHLESLRLFLTFFEVRRIKERKIGTTPMVCPKSTTGIDRRLEGVPELPCPSRCDSVRTRTFHLSGSPTTTPDSSLNSLLPQVSLPTPPSPPGPKAPTSNLTPSLA